MFAVSTSWILFDACYIESPVTGLEVSIFQFFNDERVRQKLLVGLSGRLEVYLAPSLCHQVSARFAGIGLRRWEIPDRMKSNIVRVLSPLGLDVAHWRVLRGYHRWRWFAYPLTRTGIVALYLLFGVILAGGFWVL